MSGTANITRLVVVLSLGYLAAARLSWAFGVAVVIVAGLVAWSKEILEHIKLFYEVCKTRYEAKLKGKEWEETKRTIVAPTNDEIKEITRTSAGYQKRLSETLQFRRIIDQTSEEKIKTKARGK